MALNPEEVFDTEYNPQVTTWHNDRDVDAVFTLFIGQPPQPKPNQRAEDRPTSSKPRKIVIPAKGSIKLPSEYDNGIREQNEAGVIIGGVYHALRKNDEKVMPPVASSIDDLKNKRMAEISAISAKMQQEETLKRAVELYDQMHKDTLDTVSGSKFNSNQKITK